MLVSGTNVNSRNVSAWTWPEEIHACYTVSCDRYIMSREALYIMSRKINSSLHVTRKEINKSQLNRMKLR